MKKLIALLVVCCGVVSGDVFGARAPVARRPGAPGQQGQGAVQNVPQQTSSATQSVAPGSTNARAAQRRGGATTASGASKNATSVTPTGGQTAGSGASKPGVSARAATTQKAINNGVKIAGATANVVVSDECKTKYYGCMDSFCMLDNTNGGRCLCSNRHAELETVLEQIQKLDEQSYALATSGVERINMGQDAAAVNDMVSKVTGEIENSDANKKKARKTLNLDAWNTEISVEDEEVFVNADNDIAKLKGDALHASVADMCVKQIPECSDKMSMLKMMYTQQIKADCNAYENSLKQQKNASAKKLQTAQTAMREAALEQHQNANKFDLGQCTIRFKQCMQTTAGCGEDFSKCAVSVGGDNAQTKVGAKNKTKNYTIKGASTSVTIGAMTYDTLIAKKPMCESVTKQCVAVKDKVWDTFLREVAPELKSAELIAESNLRMNCIGNISECFQKACKDNIDPNDPEGSYDMCLSRPQTMRSLCKVQIDPCEAAEPQIMDYVYARLASMRVDACTKEVKSCLTDENRCGKDYSQCVGLDTDTIINMCPSEKLTACNTDSNGKTLPQREVYENIENIITGLMLNIDNSFLAQCQNAANEAMVKVCGDTENCNNLTINENVGSRSLEYKICEYTNEADSLAINYSACRTDISQIQDSELGRGSGTIKPFSGVLDGTIYWEQVTLADDGTVSLPDVPGANASQNARAKSELEQLQNSINTAIKTIEADPIVQFCMTGRKVQGLKDKSFGRKCGNDDNGENCARFPQLTGQMRMTIAQAALKAAKDNYYKKYDELNEKMLKDYAKMGERIAQIAGENAKDARRENARISCISMALASALPRSAEPPKNGFGKVLAAAAIVGAAVAIPFTGGLSITAVGAALTTTAGTVAAGTLTVGTGAAIAAGAAGVAGIGLLGNAGSGNANGEDGSLGTYGEAGKQMVGSKATNNWNYKETITSTFEWETLNCHRCTKAQTCKTTKNPLFGNKYCKDWNDPTESCKDIQF